MIDLDVLLGAENPLSRMMSEAVLHFRSSLENDAQELASAACITENSNVRQSACRAYNYDGKAFTLVFEANLPEGHEHYWLAEMFIDDFKGEVSGVSLKDDSPIRISVCDYCHEPISSGELRLCGLPLTVADGRASCTLSQLKNNLTKSKISFTSRGYGIVQGHLKLW